MHIINPMIQYYHFNVDVNQLLVDEEWLLDSITNDFQYVLPKELLAKMLNGECVHYHLLIKCSLSIPTWWQFNW